MQPHRNYPILSVIIWLEEFPMQCSFHKTNYSNCIINCTVGICCLHMQQMSVIVPSWSWAATETVLH